MKFLMVFLLFATALFSQSINQKILFASARGEIDSLNKLLSHDSVDFSYRYANGYSALDYAIERDHRSVFKRLLEYLSYENANEVKPDSLSSKLILAVFDGNEKEVKRLLDSGADQNSMHSSGYYPLAVAARWEKAEIVNLLLKHSADVNAINNNRYHTSPLIEVTRNGNTEIAKALLAHGADINLVDVNNDPAINWATYYNQKDLVELLLKSGARIDLVGADSGDNALGIAKRMKHHEIEKLIQQFTK